MPSPEEHIAVIAESYKTIADTQQTLAQTQQMLAQGQVHMEATHRLALRLQGGALAVAGVGLLVLAFVVWQGQTILTNTQTIAAQTQVLLEQLRQR